MKSVKFKEWACWLKVRRYSNGRIALTLVDQRDGEPVATATTNLPDEPLADDEVVIKDWSENTGMVTALVAAGVIEQPHRSVVTGFVKAPVARIASTL